MYDHNLPPDSESDNQFFYDCREHDSEEFINYSSLQSVADCYTFKEQLASWVVDCQIKQVHVDQLLSIFKSLPDLHTLGLPDTC